MHKRFVAASWWAQGLLTWIAATAILLVLATLFSRFLRNPEHTWSDALAYGVLFGVAVGASSGLSVAIRSRRRRQYSGVSALPPAQRLTALRASAGGPVPDDPDVRHAAWRYADDHLRRLLDQRPAVLLVYGVATALLVLVCLANHSLALLPVVAVVAVLATLSNQEQIRRLRQAAARLAG